MRIAVIGSGIAGLTAAYTLAERHDVTLFEAEARLGGHTNTVEVKLGDQEFAVDTGFIVFNERTYPNFCRLLRELRVESHASDMSFSVSSDASGWEYCGSSLAGLFAQRRNLIRPAFYRMLSDVLRFNRLALRLLSDNPVADLTLGEFILENRFSRTFCDSYLLPMSAAIWSAPPDQMLQFPAAPLARFFANHGLLSLRNRPQWRTVTGGASRYVAAMRLARNFNVVTSSPVTKLFRKNDSVHVLAGNIERMFDHVVVAAHADDALRMLADPTAAEREILGAFTYQLNRATLHTDYSLMPRRRAAWASWNYRATAACPVTVTYWMNRLQHLDANAAIFVTLNGDSRIDPAHVIRRFTYSHPLFNSDAIAAQHRHAEISGGRTHYCGAYWGYGFHEDGAKSALAAVCTLETSHESWKAAYTKGTSVTAASPA